MRRYVVSTTVLLGFYSMAMDMQKGKKPVIKREHHKNPGGLNRTDVIPVKYQSLCKTCFKEVGLYKNPNTDWLVCGLCNYRYTRDDLLLKELLESDFSYSKGQKK